ncbi:toxin-antitoxin system YwqK family antitoxin [Psychroserpens algicola]|uniref:Toxin-antitoxin system YwqK family antitoxin n=1 Tax=Psychroserpens algicola TaxID=1719034 RepID=A0ABT0H716_9FLAO|nr:toxin-antitoxin system YwqK family antitoxin [Psychroserpens algicola]MCK8479605.1 toxin-antitoxin system YwqK family antitoxin [Psychroserpens algicola]
MKSYFFIFILTLLSLNSVAQNAVNQFDENGKRHGIWRKYFDKTKQLRYEGQFDHGKEIDTFRFYTLNRGKSVLSATKVFNLNDDTASVKFLSSKGKLISEGQMKGKLYIGKWVYYHNKSEAVMSTEYYNESGELDGEKFVYYPNGKTAEKSNYSNGKLHGESIWYAENGNILKEFQYKDDELNGVSKYFDADGNLKAEGTYRDGLKHGIWNYYEGGKLVKTKDHTKRSKNPKKQ